MAQVLQADWMVATDSDGPCHENPFILNAWARADTLWWNGNTLKAMVWFRSRRVIGIHADTITKVLGFASTRGKKYVARFGRDLGALWTAAELASKNNCTLSTGMYREVLLFITQRRCQGLLCWWLGNPRSYESCISLFETGARRISFLAAVHDCNIPPFDVPMTGSLIEVVIMHMPQKGFRQHTYEVQTGQNCVFFHSLAWKICTRWATLGHSVISMTLAIH